MAELIITKMSHYSAPCTGGKEIILLCDRVTKDDVQVRFFEVSPEKGLVWESFGEFLPNDVHKQVAISLRTPKYYDETIQQPVTVQIQLRRPSDGCVSLARNFQLIPKELDPDGLVRKRPKRTKEDNYDLLQEYIQLSNANRNFNQPKVEGGTNELPILINSQPPAITTQAFDFNEFQQNPTTQFSKTNFIGQNQIKSEMMAAPSTSGFTMKKQQIDAPQFTTPQPQPVGSPNYVGQYSPNPSAPSYSNAPSPAATAYMNSPSMANPENQQAEIPNEVMERFDSLDIDSSELIPDLDLNSSTMLNLMMDTSSGLSLPDSFSDFSNPTQRTQNRAKMILSANSAAAVAANANQSMNGSLNDPNHNCLTASSSANSHNFQNKMNTSKDEDRLKLKIDTVNNNLTNGNVATTMDTPTIEMINAFSCAMDNSNNIDDILQVLDVDNNNVN